MTTNDLQVASSFLENRFREAGVPILDLRVHAYPEETVFVVSVQESHLTRAAALGNSLDSYLREADIAGFVTVRVADPGASEDRRKPVTQGVHDPRVNRLVSLVSARARTSETQPSLHYVRDVAANLTRISTPRHNLVFGRRGAGKTALMLEAKRIAAGDQQSCVWINVQTYRREPAERVVLWVASHILDETAAFLAGQPQASRALTDASSDLKQRVEDLLGKDDVSRPQVDGLAPRLNRLLQRFTTAYGQRVLIFLDDFHYLPRDDQPEVLDLIHAFVRDADAWLKVAAIKHLSNWFRSDPPTGLQTGHDADAIDLDVTLQNPDQAKLFLEEVLKTYAEHVAIPRLSGIFSRGALDRLVLASGAVPRDYLVLCTSSIAQAKLRTRARLVGKQDVAQAAGDAAEAKIKELEEDAASDEGSATSILATLQEVRDFCLSEKRQTFFRIGFKDKERRVRQYALLQSLMDVRLIHLVNPSVSEAHQAGERAEAYMLDLSQFSGERLKKYLKVLDFAKGHIVLKETGTTKQPRIGSTPRRLLTILRAAPLLDLSRIPLEPAQLDLKA